MTRERTKILRSFGANDATTPELLEYCTSLFQLQGGSSFPTLPLSDEPHVAAWRVYEERARKEGAAMVLRGVLVQFAFPVTLGMSLEVDYQAATRRGEIPSLLSKASGLDFQKDRHFKDPSGL